MKPNNMKNRPAKKRITSIDVAKEAGVSQTMVSFVLNNVKGISIKEETRQKVLDAARKLNYQVNYNARTMRSNRAFAIGLMMDWMSQSIMFQEIVTAVKKLCEKDDITLILCSGSAGDSNVIDYIRYFNQTRIDGLIYVTYIHKAYEDLNQIHTSGIPFVCIKGPEAYPETTMIDIDYYEEGYQIAKHMIQQGYRKIAFLSDNFNYDQMGYNWQRRYHGVKSAILEFGKGSAEFVEGQLASAITTANPEKRNVEIAIEFLKANPDIDGIIDLSTTCNTFTHAAKELGISVPHQLGLGAYDNNGAIRYSFPSITTMQEPYCEEVGFAYDLLKKKVNGDKIINQKIKLRSRLIPGDSTNKNNKGELQ